MKIAIIGGVAAGTSAAAKAHRQNSDAEIVLFERDTDISYAGCGLPYYISGVIKERERVVINTAAEFAERYGVDVRINHEVVAIDKEEKTLKFINQSNGEEGKYSFDKLIVATGASSIRPSIPGIELQNIIPLRTVKDADQIKQKINTTRMERVTIIGAGLIGLEMAESFTELGLEVTVVEKLPHVLPQFSQTAAGLIEKHLAEKGVRLIVNDGVKGFSGEKQVTGVTTASGQEIKTDLVLLSLGIKPNVKLASQAGIRIGETGAIAVNAKMETSCKGIYAAGDCAESRDLLTGKPVWVPLGSTANKQGRVAGENAAGGHYQHQGILKTGITKIFELTAARTGLSLKEAVQHGFDPLEIEVTASNHAGYYPAVSKIFLRGIFDRQTGKIIGAEAVGKEGADKRIDVLNTAIYSELTAGDLFQLDLAYAPPFSTPKDPIALLGMIAEKKL